MEWTPETRSKRNATETVRRGGSVSLNFRDLGHSVGVKSSKRALLLPTKGDLLTEIAGEYRTGFLEALADGVRGSKTLRQDLLVLVDLFVAAQKQQLACLCGMLATETELLDANAQAAVNQFFAALQQSIVQRAALRAARKPGGLAPAAFAELLVALLEGSLLLSRLDAHKASLAVAKSSIQKVA